ACLGSGNVGEPRLELAHSFALLRDGSLILLSATEDLGDEGASELSAEVLEAVGRLQEGGIESETHAEAELRVVLEQRVRPRGPAALAVHGVGSGRQVRAVDRRASGGVRDEGAITEELGEGLDV